jgi:hypothetical protein
MKSLSPWESRRLSGGEGVDLNTKDRLNIEELISISRIDLNIKEIGGRRNPPRA